jgi:hypothetical protein
MKTLPDLDGWAASQTLGTIDECTTSDAEGVHRRPKGMVLRYRRLVGVIASPDGENLEPSRYCNLASVRRWNHSCTVGSMRGEMMPESLPIHFVSMCGQTSVWIVKATSGYLYGQHSQKQRTQSSPADAQYSETKHLICQHSAGPERNDDIITDSGFLALRN